MMPTFWPAVKEKFRVTNLWHVSAPFYVRTPDPTDDDPYPQVLIGRTQNFAWDLDGTYAYSEQQVKRVHGDVHVVDGRLRFFLGDYDIGVQRREYAKSTKPSVKGWAIPKSYPNFGYGYSAQAAARSSVVGNMERVYFHRILDDKAFGPYIAASMADPAGYRLWQYHQNTVGLTYNAYNALIAYSKPVATLFRTYAPGAGGVALEEREKIIGFTGMFNEDPKWIAITGQPVIGTIVGNGIVGKLGPNHIVFQQAAIEQLENINARTGYVYNGNEWMLLKDADGKDVYKQVPFNSFANWGDSPNIRYLWSGRVWRVDVVDAGDEQGNITTTATRTLIGTTLNEWRQVEGTGKDKDGKDSYVYLQRSRYDETTGSYVDYYELKLDADGKPVPIPAQYNPAVKSEMQDGKRKEIGNAGYILCSVLLRSNGQVVEKRAPWDAGPALQERDANGNLSYIPAGMVEVNDHLWLSVSRYTVGSDGSPRWMYSRNQGGTWTLIDTRFTNNGLAVGISTARKDLQVQTKEIFDDLKANEVVMAPKSKTG